MSKVTIWVTMLREDKTRCEGVLRKNLSQLRSPHIPLR